MKILYVYDVIFPYVKGGAEKRFWELARRMAKKGHAVDLVGTKFWEGEDSLVKDGVKIYGIAKKRSLYSSSGRRNIFPAICFTAKLFFFLIKRRYDVIDCNIFPYLPFFAVKFVSAVKRVALVITWQEVWGAYWFKYLGFIKGTPAYLIERLAISLSGNIIVHSSGVRQRLIRRGIREHKIRLIPNGIDLKLVEDIPQDQERSDLIFAGRLIKDKNVDVLLEAVQLASLRFPALKCLIIGDGPQRKDLLSRASALKLHKNIIFKGAIEYHKVISLEKAAKIFVLPSTREGFAIAVIEAMACGLAVITVGHPMNAATELVADGKNGFVCALDAGGIARKIILCLENDGLTAEMRQGAKCFAQDYDWAGIARQNEALYNLLVGG